MGRYLIYQFIRRVKWGRALEDTRLDRQYAEQRYQAHDGPDPQVFRGAAGLTDDVVIETVALMPHPDRAADPVDGVSNPQEVLKEFRGDSLIGRPGLRQFERDGEHIEAEQTHPRRPVGLLQAALRWQKRPAAVEHADIIQAQEATLEHVATVGVLAIDPPGEVQ